MGIHGKPDQSIIDLAQSLLSGNCPNCGAVLEFKCVYRSGFTRVVDMKEQGYDREFIDEHLDGYEWEEICWAGRCRGCDLYNEFKSLPVQFTESSVSLIAESVVKYMREGFASVKTAQTA